MRQKFKYTIIDKLAYDIYIDATKNFNISKMYITLFSNIGFKNFVETHGKDNGKHSIFYNQKTIIQKIRKLKLEKIKNVI